jgi:short-subunit dehydrogenase
MKLNNKIIIITGANKGIGLHLSKSLLRLGFKVIGISRNTNNMKNIISDNFKFYKADISKTKEIEKIIDFITTENKVEILINNAAIFESATLTEQKTSSIEKIIDINIKGTIMMSKMIIPHMIKNKKGKIINLSSVSGIHGIENQAVYSASKHALAGFAESLNYEIIPKGLQMINICPGGINTSLWNESNPYPGDVNKLLSPEDIFMVIKMILDSNDRVVFKNIVLFPNNEIH